MIPSTTTSPTKLKVAILGATGTVGQRFITLLADHPLFEIHALCASPRSVGQLYSQVVQWKLCNDIPTKVSTLMIEPCLITSSDSRLAQCDVAFSGLDSSVATEIEAHIIQSGIPVFSNAKNYRMHPLVPLVVPTANADHLGPMVKAQLNASNQSLFTTTNTTTTSLNNDVRTGYIVTNSNCSTTGLAIVLRALIDQFGDIDQVSVVTLQAISGAGYPGLPVLDVFDNVVPYISEEENKIETEPHKVLGLVDTKSGTHVNRTDMTISASCNRVPVLDGHTINVSIRFRNRNQVPTPQQVTLALQQYQPPESHVLIQCPSYPKNPIFVTTQCDRPQPRLDRDRGNGMTVTVGRIRECSLFDIKLVALTHNTILGAAGSSLLNAEIAYVQGLLTPRDT